MEALKFLKLKKASFAVNHFSRDNEPIAFVKRLYKLGVSHIEIDFDEEHLEDEDAEEFYADSMVITFPKTLPRMAKGFDILLAILEERPDEISADVSSGRDMNWKKDKGVLLWWD